MSGSRDATTGRRRFWPAAALLLLALVGWWLAAAPVGVEVARPPAAAKGGVGATNPAPTSTPSQSTVVPRTAVVRGGRLEGRVVDAWGGVVAGALLTIACPSCGPDHSARELQADSSGAFSIEAAVGQVELSVRAPGYATEHQRLMVPQRAVTVVLRASASIVGKVIQAPGASVIDEVVEITARQVSGDSPAGPVATRADAEGRFILRDLHPGRYHLLARSAHLRGELLMPRAVGIGDRAKAEIVLRQGVPVRGQVVGPRGPCTGGGARLYQERMPPLHAPITADGHLEFLAVPAGRYSLRVECDAHEALQDDVQVGAVALEGQRWAVRAGATLRGMVLEASGAPTAATVTLHDLAQVQPRHGPRTVRSGPDGGFELRGLSSGRYRAQVVASDGQRLSPAAELSIEQLDPPPIVLRMHPLGSLVVQVVDRDGAAVDGVAVFCTGRATGSRDAKPGPGGVHHIVDLPPGDYQVHASNGSAPVSHPQPIRVAANSEASLTLVFGESAGRIAGVVRDAAGRGVSDALVSAEPLGRLGIPDAVTDRLGRGRATALDGSFSFEGLAGGTYRVVARRPTGQRVHADAEPGGELVLQLPAVTALSGHVIDVDGRPVSDAALSLVPDQGVPVSTQSDGAGRFSFDNAISGPALLRIRKGPMQSAERLQITDGERMDLGSLVLHRSVQVRGQLVDEAGSALAGLRVTLRGEGALGRAISDQHGRFVLSDMASGKAHLLVSGASGGARYGASKELTLAPDAALDLRLVVSAKPLPYGAAQVP